MTNIVRPGKVAWTGDNPFIYLKTDPTGQWSALGLTFRIAMSDFGSGNVMLLIEDPYLARTRDEAVQVCLTDNRRLADFLIEDFVRSFGVFKGAAALDSMEVIDGAEFTVDADGNDRYVQSANSAKDDLDIEMAWEELAPAFAAVVPPSASATGRHEMLSVFRIAESARIRVNGRQLHGAPVSRMFLNGEGKSAGVALSETWTHAGTEGSSRGSS